MTKPTRVRIRHYTLASNSNNSKNQVIRITTMYTLHRACQLAPDYKLLKPSSLNNTLYGKAQSFRTRMYSSNTIRGKTKKKHQRINMHNKSSIVRSSEFTIIWLLDGEGRIHCCGPGRRRQGFNIVDLSRSSRRPRNVVDKPKVYLRNIHNSGSVVLQSGKGHHRNCTIKPSHITYLAVELLFFQNSTDSTHCRKEIKTSS